MNRRCSCGDGSGSVPVTVPVLMDAVLSCTRCLTVLLTVPISNIINNDDVVLFVVLYLL